MFKKAYSVTSTPAKKTGAIVATANKVLEPPANLNVPTYKREGVIPRTQARQTAPEYKPMVSGKRFLPIISTSNRIDVAGVKIDRDLVNYVTKTTGKGVYRGIYRDPSEMVNKKRLSDIAKGR
jgi:hypothetical protein